MTIAYINGGYADVTGSSSSVAASAVSVTTGNAIVAWVATYDTAGYKTVSGIADTALNTYNLCGSRYQFFYAGAYYINVEIWVALNITGNAANVVTASYTTANTGGAIQVVQYSGMKTSSAYDTGYDPAGNIDASSPYTTTSDDTAEANECVIGFFKILGYDTGTFSDSGSSVVRYAPANGLECVADKAVAAAGAATVAMVSTNTASEHFCIAKAFKQAAGGASASVYETLNFAEALD